MNQQEKDLFNRLLELQSEVVDILIKIKGIETETVLQPELFSIPKFDPVADLFNFREKTKSFLKELYSRYGFNQFERNYGFVKDAIWQYKISDFAKILRDLEQRGIVKYTNIGEGFSKRLHTIQFLKEIK
jgi:hypothetical protein